MRYLLDTHALAWWLLDAPQLGRRASQVIGDSENQIYVSPISAFEIAGKNRLGKWPEINDIVENFERILRAERFQHLAVSIRHALVAGSIPGMHRDPFDRLLAAQCKLENLTLLTVDPAFGEFGIDTVW